MPMELLEWVFSKFPKKTKKKCNFYRYSAKIGVVVAESNSQYVLKAVLISW